MWWVDKKVDEFNRNFFLPPPRAGFPKDPFENGISQRTQQFSHPTKLSTISNLARGKNTGVEGDFNTLSFIRIIG
jgi:hypothetical protein